MSLFYFTQQVPRWKLGVSFTSGHPHMPEPSIRNGANVPGPFYVDSTCIDCDQCRSHAPAFFKRDDDEGMSYVHLQPITEADIAEAMKALEGCPTESIGRDG